MSYSVGIHEKPALLLLKGNREKWTREKEEEFVCVWGKWEIRKRGNCSFNVIYKKISF